MSRNGMRPAHPGEVLRDELEALDLPSEGSCRSPGYFRHPHHHLNGRRGIAADPALRLSRYLGTTAEFWLNLQKTFELWTTERKAGKRIAERITPRRAA